ncbi:MAG: hypothetical protein OXH09_15105 [Gammaproteobacteria bacterium]|nr:hypothetical protein [Gammaproteobacteria bacterium]
MALSKYIPKTYQDGRGLVTVDAASFKFNVAARNVAELRDVHYMQVHLDSEERLIVFQPMTGTQKMTDWLKLGSRKGSKSLPAKGIVSSNDWIKAVSRQDIADRKFEIRRYDGEVRGWSIQLMPAFEKSVVPSEIHRLENGEKGIYRYRGGDSGDEVIYIGKGSVRDRFQQESQRKDWEVARIEYSIVKDDQIALEWEAFWIRRFQDENNGRLPRFNQVGGHVVSSGDGKA